ncbi:hypothetical protein K439DRAFT_1624366 [Ramaria rubella]|nr:hypothetical protein K439DRAFT_1624366 [Ramaria rubella]
MSTVFITGNFCIVGGRHSSDGPHYFAYYQTSLQCSSSETLADVKIRVYSPQNESLHRDCTVVNVIGRLFAPSKGSYLIDALSMVPFPSNPEDNDEYEASIINDTTAKVWAVGTVLNNAEQWVNGSSRVFNIAVSNYI